MKLKDFLQKLDETPEKIEFNTTIALIDSLYDFSPTSFKNGNLNNEAGQNSGSCKLFSFALLHKLTVQQTLFCFGQYYQEVLDTPQKSDHQNIRNFIASGWEQITFSNGALVEKI